MATTTTFPIYPMSPITSENVRGLCYGGSTTYPCANWTRSRHHGLCDDCFGRALACATPRERLMFESDRAAEDAEAQRDAERAMAGSAS